MAAGRPLPVRRWAREVGERRRHGALRGGSPVRRPRQPARLRSGDEDFSKLGLDRIPNELFGHLEEAVGDVGGLYRSVRGVVDLAVGSYLEVKQLEPRELVLDRVHQPEPER